MKTVCKTNIRKALCRAMRDNKMHDVNDDWQVYVDSWGRVVLYDWQHDRDFCTGSVVWCCFDSKREAVEYLADELLEQYESWVASHPWDRLRGVEQLAFSNACDYFVYGESYCDWVERGHDLGLSKQRGREVWAMAFWATADECAPTNYLEAYENLIKEAA